MSLRLVLTLIHVALLCVSCSDTSSTRASSALRAAQAKASTADREWRAYLGDGASQQWSPLDEIHPGNVAELEVAWEYASGGAGQIQTNPLIVKGVLYGVSPTLRAFALDAETGEELWSFDEGTGGGPAAPNRGLAWWSDGNGTDRLFLPAGERVWALDATTGQPIRSFGDGGSIRLRDGLSHGDDFVIATTPGSVFEDLLI